MEISARQSNHSAIFFLACSFTFGVMCVAIAATALISTPRPSVNPIPGVGSGLVCDVLESGRRWLGAVLRGARSRCTKRAETSIFKLSESD